MFTVNFALYSLVRLTLNPSLELLIKEQKICIVVYWPLLEVYNMAVGLTA